MSNDGCHVPAYHISSPVSLWLRRAKIVLSNKKKIDVVEPLNQFLTKVHAIQFSDQLVAVVLSWLIMFLILMSILVNFQHL